MTDDITHDLGIVRESLQAEGLINHVKLIDTAIEEVSGLREANHHYRDSAAHDEKAIASLRDRLAGARKALEPFASLTDLAAIGHKDSRPFIYAFDSVIGSRLTVGHLRAAKAALSDDLRETTAAPIAVADPGATNATQPAGVQTYRLRGGLL